MVTPTVKMMTCTTNTMDDLYNGWNEDDSSNQYYCQDDNDSYYWQNKDDSHNRYLYKVVCPILMKNCVFPTLVPTDEGFPLSVAICMVSPVYADRALSSSVITCTVHTVYPLYSKAIQLMHTTYMVHLGSIPTPVHTVLLHPNPPQHPRTLRATTVPVLLISEPAILATATASVSWWLTTKMPSNRTGRECQVLASSSHIHRDMVCVL